MNNDIAGVVSSEPTTTIEIGSVASAGSSASRAPASPATMILIASCEPKIACANTSTATFRFARLSATEASVGASGAIEVFISRGHPERRARLTYGRAANLVLVRSLVKQESVRKISNLGVA